MCAWTAVHSFDLAHVLSCLLICAVFAATVNSLIQFPEQLRDAPEICKQPGKDNYLKRSRVAIQQDWRILADV